MNPDRLISSVFLKRAGLIFALALGCFALYLLIPTLRQNDAVADRESQEGFNQLYFQTALKGHYSAIDEVGDPAFSEYVRNVLEKRCPFYKPDGASYRDCLWETVKEKTAAYDAGNSKLKEAEIYCQNIGEQFDGLISGEIILSCMAYKLSQP